LRESLWMIYMTRAIEQTAVFESTPSALYELFMNSAKHSAATGAPARISRKVGGKWSAHSGMIGGKNLALVPNKMIVQAWRSAGWKTTDPDSVLVVRFERAPGGARVHLSHVGVPQHDHKGVTQGWRKYYWKPWKKYLAAQKRSA
jgi:activator of HSP90 ATPase